MNVAARRSKLHRVSIVAFAGSTCLAASVAWAQPAGGGGGGDKPARATVLGFELMDYDALLVDPKDAVLRKALNIIPARLKDLPAELRAPEDVPAAEIVELIGLVAGTRTRFLAEYNMKNQDEENRMGAGVQLSFLVKDEGKAKRVDALVKRLLDHADNFPEITPAKGPFAGMSQIETPGGMARWGGLKGEDGWRYEVNFGKITPAEQQLPAFNPTKLTFGGQATLAFRGSLDLQPLTPLVNMFAGNAGDPMIGEIVSSLSESGLIGEGAMHWEFFGGTTDTATFSYSAARGVGRFAKANGLTKTPLTEAELKVIPSDATCATLSKFDLASGIEGLRQMVEANENIADGLRRVQEATGVNVIDDLLGSVGNVAGAYMSDSTGGGTLGSGVVVIQLKDPEKMRGAVAKLTTQFNQFAANRRAANGYVAFRTYEVDGLTITSLQAPGLPVPLELSGGISGDWMVVAFNPQAAVAGLKQATGQGDAGLMSNEKIAALFPKGKGFTTIGYMDTAYNLRVGYPLLTMAGSAMQNMIRTPKGADPSREVGFIVPPYRDLAKGVRSAVSFAYWDGDDMINESYSDRSMLVTVGAAAGAIYQAAPLIVGGIALVGGAAEAMQEMRPMRRGGMNPNFMLLPTPLTPFEDTLHWAQDVLNPGAGEASNVPPCTNPAATEAPSR